jgi:hypothetical protein
MRLISAIGAFLLIAAPVSANDQMTPLNTVSAGDQGPAYPSDPPPSPRCAGGAEQALRHQIQAIEAGQPDYTAMQARTANQLRTQITNIQPSLNTQWGALQSLKLRRAAWGIATYEATFERAHVEWRIACQNSQGKITGLAFKTLS